MKNPVPDRRGSSGANRHRWSIAVLLTATTIVGAAAPLPTSAQDMQLSPVRRTTIASSDPEASLRFYRDLLGMRVEYDLIITDPSQLAAFAPGASQGRAIALRSGEKMGGTIGLFHAPGMKRGGGCDRSAAGGAVAIMMLTGSLDALYRRLKDAAVPFVDEVHNYDNARGKGSIGSFAVFDPDCVRVVFAQIRRETLEQSEQR